MRIWFYRRCSRGFKILKVVLAEGFRVFDLFSGLRMWYCGVVRGFEFFFDSFSGIVIKVLAIAWVCSKFFDGVLTLEARCGRERSRYFIFGSYVYFGIFFFYLV